MTVLKIKTFAAHPNHKGHIIPILHLTTGKALPLWSDEGSSEESPKSFNEVKAEYQKEAVKVVDAMLKTMPQGFTDQLLAELIARKATVLSPPQDSPIKRVSTIQYSHPDWVGALILDSSQPPEETNKIALQYLDEESSPDDLSSEIVWMDKTSFNSLPEFDGS